MDKYEDLLSSSVNSLRTCKKYIETRLDEEERHELLDIFKDITKKYCEIDEEHKKCKSAIDKTTEYFSNADNDCTKQVQQVYEEFLTNETNQSDYTEHPIWKRLCKIQKSSQNEISVNADCSVLISQSFQPPVDPITKQPILDPYKNKVCGHVYDYNTITKYIKSAKNSNVRCPYIGCNNVNMSENFLEKDDELKDEIDDFIATCT